MPGGRIPFGTIGPDLVPNIAAPPALDIKDIAASTSGGAQLQGLSRGLDAVQTFGQKLVEARDSVNVSNAVVDSNDQLDKFRQDLEHDPDVAGREAKFAAKAAEVRQAAADKLGRSDAVTNFTLRFNPLSRTMQNSVRQDARSEELQNFRQDLGESLDKLATQSAFAKSDQERVALQAEGEKQLVDAVRTQRLSAVQANAMRKGYLGSVDAALAGQLVRTNPGAAIAALGDPNKFTYLSAGARVQLQTQAQVRSESLGVQARAELRADAGEVLQDIQRGAIDGNMPAPQDVQAIIKRAGPQSALGVRVQRAWDFYGQVNADTQGKTIPQLQAAVAEAQGHRPAADAAPPPSVYVVSDPALNGGRPTHVPAQGLEQAAATKAAIESGKPLPSFDTEQQAADAAPPPAPVVVAPAAPSPQDLHRARVLQTALQGRIAARDKDPLGYVLKAYPTIGEQAQAIAATEQGNDETAKSQLPDRRNAMWAAVLEAERREGVPEHKVALLTSPGAADLRTRFLTTADPQARVDLVDQLRTQYGDQWDRVNRQIWDGKAVPGDVQVISLLPPDANVPKAEVAQANQITDEQAKTIIGGKQLSAIDDATRKTVSAIAPTLTNAPGGAQVFATYQGQIGKLARLYVIRGESDPDAAAHHAADTLFFDHWQVIEGQGGATLRVPKVQGEPIVAASAVRQMQQAVTAALPTLDLVDPGGPHMANATPAARKDALVQGVKANGYWMTTADDKGMVLVIGHNPATPVMLLHPDDVGSGRPPRHAPAPLIVPFDSINALATQGEARTNLRMREGENAGLEAAGGEPNRDLGSDPAAPAARAWPAWIGRMYQNVDQIDPRAGAIP